MAVVLTKNRSYCAGTGRGKASEFETSLSYIYGKTIVSKEVRESKKMRKKMEGEREKEVDWEGSGEE